MVVTARVTARGNTVALERGVNRVMIPVRGCPGGLRDVELPSARPTDAGRLAWRRHLGGWRGVVVWLLLAGFSRFGLDIVCSVVPGPVRSHIRAVPGSKTRRRRPYPWIMPVLYGYLESQHRGSAGWPVQIGTVAPCVLALPVLVKSWYIAWKGEYVVGDRVMLFPIGKWWKWSGCSSGRGEGILERGSGVVAHLRNTGGDQTRGWIDSKMAQEGRQLDGTKQTARAGGQERATGKTTGHDVRSRDHTQPRGTMGGDQPRLHSLA